MSLDSDLADLRERFPQPGDDAMDALRHVVDLHAHLPDDEFVLLGTSNLYGPGVRTGLSHGDLRELRSRLELVEHELALDWEANRRNRPWPP